MAETYEMYLEEVCRLVRERLALAEKRRREEETASLLAELRDRAEKVRQMEERGLKSGEFWPLAYVSALAECSPFERHMLYLLLYGAMGGDGYPGELRDGLAGRGYFPALAVASYEEKVSLAERWQMRDRSSFFTRFFLCRQESGDGELRYEPDGRLVHLIIAGETEYPRYEGKLHVYDRNGSLPPYEDDGGMTEGVLRLLREPGSRAVCQLCGEKGSGKKTFLRCLAAKASREIVLWRVTEDTFHDMEENVRIWQRECFLWNAIPAVELWTEDMPRELVSALDRSLREFPLIFLLTEKSRNLQLSNGRFLPLGERGGPAPSSVWLRESEKYTVGEGIAFKELAGKFRLTPGQIVRAFEMADLFRCMEGGVAVNSEQLHRACCHVLQGTMGNSIKRIEKRYRFEDMVLPDGQLRRLREACDQVRFQEEVYGEWGLGKKMLYGRGVSILFSGAAGTGKTMAAHAVACELGMELYRVILPSVVSKYIGETEKNLNEIFDRAGRRRAILFFDEADALFGRRTEIKDANDKYGNMEAAFLLQKMEEYDGVTILATNYYKNFDEAFRRRLKFIIEFPFPGEKERAELWRKAIPEDRMSDSIDVEFLSRQFELSGSNIRNIVLHAAFLAAASGEDFGMKQLIPAVRNEYEKLGKTLRQEELGEYYVLDADGR